MKKRLAVILATFAALAAATGASSPVAADGLIALAGTGGGYWSSEGIGPFSMNLSGSWKGAAVPRATYTCFGSWSGYVRGEYEGTISCALEPLGTEGAAPGVLNIDVWLSADNAGLFGMHGYVLDADLPYLDCAGASIPAALGDDPYLRGTCRIT